MFKDINESPAEVQFYSQQTVVEDGGLQSRSVLCKIWRWEENKAGCDSFRFRGDKNKEEEEKKKSGRRFLT